MDTQRPRCKCFVATRPHLEPLPGRRDPLRLGPPERRAAPQRSQKGASSPRLSVVPPGAWSRRRGCPEWERIRGPRSRPRDGGRGSGVAGGGVSRCEGSGEVRPRGRAGRRAAPCTAGSVPARTRGHSGQTPSGLLGDAGPVSTTPSPCRRLSCRPALLPTQPVPHATVHGQPGLSNGSEVASGAAGMSPSPPSEKRAFSTKDSGRGGQRVLPGV